MFCEHLFNGLCEFIDGTSHCESPSCHANGLPQVEI